MVSPIWLDSRSAIRLIDEHRETSADEVLVPIIRDSDPLPVGE